MKLTAKQKAALDALGSDRQRLFCIEVVRNGGNGAAAARAVGYAEASSHVEAARLLANASLAAAVASLKERVTSVKLGSLESRRRYMRHKALHAVEEKDQLKALEMLGRTHGDFVDRHEHTGKDGAPVAVQVTIDLASAKKIARGEQDG